MSQANIPNITPIISVTFDSAINLILASIALEEISLAHILNAEGEKLQYVLGTLPGANPPPMTLSDLLIINNSVREMLKEVSKKEWILNNKLESAVEAIKAQRT